MKTSDTQSEQTNAFFAGPDEEAEQERRQKRIDATDRRAAAYDRLSLSEAEKAAMEWACSRRGISSLAVLKPLFDGAESIGDEGVAEWLDGALFSDESVVALREGLQEAERRYQKWQHEDRIAGRAENATIWFLRICIIMLVLILLGGLVMRGSTNSRPRMSSFRWYDAHGPATADQRSFFSFDLLNPAMQTAPVERHQYGATASG